MKKPTQHIFRSLWHKDFINTMKGTILVCFKTIHFQGFGYECPVFCLFLFFSKPFISKILDMKILFLFVFVLFISPFSKSALWFILIFKLLWTPVNVFLGLLSIIFYHQFKKSLCMYQNQGRKSLFHALNWHPMWF